MRRRHQQEQAREQAYARARQAAAPASCGLCQRPAQLTTRHHLVPREEGGRYGETVDLCPLCHRSVHRFLSNHDLARHYHTIELLRAAPALQPYLRWIQNRRFKQI